MTERCAYPGCTELADPRWYIHLVDCIQPACDGHGCADGGRDSCKCDAVSLTWLEELKLRLEGLPRLPWAGHGGGRSGGYVTDAHGSVTARMLACGNYPEQYAKALAGVVGAVPQLLRLVETLGAPLRSVAAAVDTDPLEPKYVYGSTVDRLRAAMPQVREAIAALEKVGA